MHSELLFKNEMIWPISGIWLKTLWRGVGNKEGTITNETAVYEGINTWNFKCESSIIPQCLPGYGGELSITKLLSFQCKLKTESSNWKRVNHYPSLIFVLQVYFY